jgi:hypothetical protein
VGTSSVAEITSPSIIGARFRPGAVPAHTFFQQRQPDGLKSTARGQESTALNAEENQGESRFSRHWMSGGIGTRFCRGFVGFQVLDRLGIRRHFNRTCG